MNEKQLLHITRIEVGAGPDPHINTIALWDDGTYDILFTEDCNIPYGEKTVKLGGRKGLKSASGNITRSALIEMVENIYYTENHSTMKIIVKK